MNATISSLTNGTTYAVLARATSTNGASPASTPVSITPVPPLPNAPTVSGIAGNGFALLTITPGATNAATVTGWEYSTDAGATWAGLTTTPGNGGTRSAIVPNLTNATTYAILTRATSANGPSPASTPVTITPTAPAPNPGPGTNPNPGPGTNPNPGPGTNPNPGPGTNPNPGPGASDWFQDPMTSTQRANLLTPPRPTRPPTAARNHA